MLDIEIVTQPTQTALNVVSVEEFARHLRLSATLRNNATWIGNMTDALTETVDRLHGFSGELNRMILPCTIKRFLTSFPASGKPIYLPYPDLIKVDAITIEDGSSPQNNIDPASYVVTTPLIPEIHAVGSWPSVASRPRAVSVTYQAGYGTYPASIKRYVKILAAHMMENPEATIMEPRQMQINRKVEFGVDSLRAALRIPVAYDDWV
jgi:hypothetical protein